MKVFLAGEGKDELGDWCKHPSYRDGSAHPGLIETLLTKAGLRFETANGIQWSRIPKFNRGDPRPNEIRNVLGAAQAAVDLRCEVLVFVRDRDRYEDREADITAGIQTARLQFPELKICGAVAIEEIEAWVLAVMGERGAHNLADPKTALSLKYQATTRNEKVRLIEANEFADIASDATSLLNWLEQLKAVFPT